MQTIHAVLSADPVAGTIPAPQELAADTENELAEDIEPRELDAYASLVFEMCDAIDNDAPLLCSDEEGEAVLAIHGKTHDDLRADIEQIRDLRREREHLLARFDKMFEDARLAAQFQNRLTLW